MKGKPGTAKKSDARCPDRQLQTLAIQNVHERSRWLNKRFGSEGWRRLPSVLESVFWCCASDYEVAGRCHFGHLARGRMRRWLADGTRTECGRGASALSGADQLTEIYEKSRRAIARNGDLGRHAVTEGK